MNKEAGIASARTCVHSAPVAEAALLARARDGDSAARAALIERNIALVRHVATHYRGLGLPMDDLMQEGAIGLLQAIDTYDPGRGAAFSTYARWPIRCAIGRAVVQRGRVVRLPRRLVWHGAGAVNGAATPASLDAPIDDRGTPLAAVLADPSAADPEVEAVRHERERVVAGAVEHLAPRRRYVIEHYFGLCGEPQNLRELAADMHISRQRAQSIRNEGLSELAAELDQRADLLIAREGT